MPSRGYDQLSTHGAVNGADKIGKHVRRLTAAGDPLNVKGLDQWTDWTWHGRTPVQRKKACMQIHCTRFAGRLYFHAENARIDLRSDGKDGIRFI